MTILTFEDTEEVGISRKSKDRHDNDQKIKEKQWSSKYYTEKTQQNQLHKKPGLTQVLRMSKQKSLKIPRGQSESVYRRANNDLQNIHIKLNIE